MHQLWRDPTVNPLYTEERQIPQHVREIFWLVPVALARKLHDCGHYAAALDWYQTVFAYQLPRGPKRLDLSGPRPRDRPPSRITRASRSG